MARPRETPPADVHMASVQVLTSSELFRSVVAFIDGVPQHVLQFKATEFDPYSKPIMGSYESSVVGSDDCNDDMSVAMLSDYLWQRAVLRGNKRVLDAIDALSKTLRYAHSSHMRIVGVVGYAVLFRETDSATIDLLDWLYTRFCDPQQRHISEMLFELLALTPQCDNNTTSVLALQWLHARGYDFPSSMMDAAATSGNLALVQFLHAHGRNGCSTRAMDNAARHGHLEVVNFLHDYRSEGCTALAMTRALEYGHLEVVKFLHEHRSEGYTSDAVDRAAANGHLRCVAFAHEHDIHGFSVSTMSVAVRAGHLDVVNFLCQHRSEGCTLESLLAAETHGHHDVVDFLCRHRPVANVNAAIQQATQRGLVRLVAKFWCRTVLSPGELRYKYDSDAQ